MQEHVLDRYQQRFGILNCLYGAQVMHSEDMAAVFCRATNDWIRDEWLNRDPRLRASIVIAAHNTELAVAEIERRADDMRFVQVLMLVSGEVTLGRRQLWPIYVGGEAWGSPIGIHAGSAYRYAPTAVGWPSYYRRGLCRAISRLRESVAEHDLRGRVREIPRAQGGRDRIGPDLAERIYLARRQDLEGVARGSSLGDARAIGDHSRARSLHGPADRRSRRERRQSCG